MNSTSDHALLKQFVQQHPTEAIATLTELDPEQLAQFVRQLDRAEQLTIVAHLSSRRAARVLAHWPTAEAVALLGRLPFLAAVPVLRYSDKAAREQLLSAMPTRLGRMLRRSLSYTMAQVGSHIDPLVPVLHATMTIQQVLDYLRADPAQAYRHLFVIDQQRILVGRLAVIRLLTAPSEEPLHRHMKPPPPPVVAEMTATDVLAQWNEAYFELPVTTTQGEFIGVVTRQTLKRQYAEYDTTDLATTEAGGALTDLYLVGLTSIFGKLGNN